MDNNLPLHLLFQQLLEKEEFSSVVQYDKDELLKNLSDKEKELLALLMVRYAEKTLNEDSKQAEYYLNKAKEIASNNLKVLLQVSNVFADQVENPLFLQAAIHGYREAFSHYPEEGEILLHWGSALFLLGRLQQDSEALLEADLLLKSASELLQDKGMQKQPILSILRSQIWHTLAKQSGEAADYTAAIEHYQRAALFEVKQPMFWNDYANALIDLSKLLKQPKILENAIEIYRKAIRLDPRFFPAQYNLALCYHYLYDLTKKNSLFWQAHEQYSHCNILQSQHASLAYSWGSLLLTQAKIRRDGDLLGQACDQLEKAALLKKHDVDIATQLCEAFIWAGAIIEDLSMLKHAEETLKNILSSSPDHYYGWCTSALCQYELGYYFNEASLMEEAILKYSKAIEIEQSNSRAWEGLANCYLALGELKNDRNLLETAVQFFAQAAEFDGPFFPQFWNDWGVSLMRLAELTEEVSVLEAAVAKFEQAVDLDLEFSDGDYVDPEWLYTYGCSLGLLGTLTEEPVFYEKSIQILSKAIELDPSSHPAKYNIAVTYMNLGELVNDLELLHKATELFALLIEADPEDDLSWNEWGLCLTYIAFVLQEEAYLSPFQQYLEEAEGKLQRALSLGNEAAYYNLACVFSLLGNYETALSYLEKAESRNALPSIEEVMYDEWLEGLRQTPDFRRFWSALVSKYGISED